MNGSVNERQPRRFAAATWRRRTPTADPAEQGLQERAGRAQPDQAGLLQQVFTFKVLNSTEPATNCFDGSGGAKADSTAGRAGPALALALGAALLLAQGNQNVL